MIIIERCVAVADALTPNELFQYHGCRCPPVFHTLGAHDRIFPETGLWNDQLVIASAVPWRLKILNVASRASEGLQLVIWARMVFLAIELTSICCRPGPKAGVAVGALHCEVIQ